MSKQGTDQQLRQYAAELEQQVIRRRLIYSGCGCDVIEHFPDYCPTCRIAELQATIKRYENGFQGACECCESVAEKNLALVAALKSIVDTAPVNGEDCSFVLAKSALNSR